MGATGHSGRLRNRSRRRRGGLRRTSSAWRLPSRKLSPGQRRARLRGWTRVVLKGPKAAGLVRQAGQPGWSGRTVGRQRWGRRMSGGVRRERVGSKRWTPVRREARAKVERSWSATVVGESRSCQEMKQYSNGSGGSGSVAGVAPNARSAAWPEPSSNSSLQKGKRGSNSTTVRWSGNQRAQARSIG